MESRVEHWTCSMLLFQFQRQKPGNEKSLVRLSLVLQYKRNNAVIVLAVECWTSSIPLGGQ